MQAAHSSNVCFWHSGGVGSRFWLQNRREHSLVLSPWEAAARSEARRIVGRYFITV